MNPKTRLRSTAMRAIASERLLNFRRARARTGRKLLRRRPMVEYFHQVDDPYSHLAVQKLVALVATYKLDFRVHLVSSANESYQGDATRFHGWALADAISIADYFSCTLCSDARPPDQDQVKIANDWLKGSLDDTLEFASSAFDLGETLFRGGRINPGGSDAASLVAAGNKRRHALGHYLGGMFYFEGEWYWGVDRLHLLEARLRSEGYCIDLDLPVCAPMPVINLPAELDCSSVTLEYFPSLRSPYTAIGHSRVVDLIDRSNVTLDLRPVMPMMMRGVPAPRSKQFYIMQDAVRESKFYQVPFGRFVDPLGEPVKLAFSLFPAAVAEHRGLDFITAYLSASFAEGIDITSTAGMTQVANNAGLEFSSLIPDEDWQQRLEVNIQALLESGLWGVPSFRVTGGDRVEAFSCWGQDRIWRVEAEIGLRLGVDSATLIARP